MKHLDQVYITPESGQRPESFHSLNRTMKGNMTIDTVPLMTTAKVHSVLAQPPGDWDDELDNEFDDDGDEEQNEEEDEAGQ